jgi:hypothetical protein
MFKKINFTVEQEEDIIKKYLNGNSLRNIANDYSVVKETIRKILIKNNIERRDMRNWYHFRKYKFNENYFEIIDTPEKAYWLGFIMADGHVSKDGLCIALNEKDVYHLIKFLKDINCDGTNIKYDYKLNKVQIDLYSKCLVKSLNNLGLFNDKSYTCFYPNIQEELNKYFIRGVFDGDGSLMILKRKKKENKKQVIDYVLTFTGTILLTNKINYIISDNCNVAIKNIEIKNNGNYSVLRYSGRKQVLKFLNWLYSGITICLDRKYDLYLTIPKILKEYNI